MRVSFSVHGHELTGAVEVGTLSYKQVVPHRADRVDALAREVVEVLARGNRAHTLSDSNLRDLRAVGQQLFGLLVPGGLACRLHGGSPALYLQVDEQLVLVPWELLHDGEMFWCRRYDLGRAVATPQAVAGRVARIPSVGPLRMLVVCADPRGDLGAVQTEGQELVRRLDDTGAIDVHLLIDPTVEAVRRALREHDLVHFAGHADHDPEHPEQSGWHLSDGKLTAAAVRELAGGRMPLLVFSNACRSCQTTSSWQADNPGRVYGLANAFLLAGVRLYLGTQWEVVDGQSGELALGFYEALARGASAGAAVRVAREEVIRSRGDSALAWASYVLYGDPETCPIPPAASRRTQPPLPSASVLEARGEAPWKRPPACYDKAIRSSTTVPVVGRGRRSRALVFGLALLLLAAIGGGAWLVAIRGDTDRPSLQRSGVGPAEDVPGSTDEVDAARPPRPATEAALHVGQLEPGGATEPLPLVALLDSPRSQLRRCMRRAIVDARRFRLVDPSRVDQLLEAEHIEWRDPLQVAEAQRLARSLEAEIALYWSALATARRPPEISVLDVLTGEPVHRQPLASVGRAGCAGVVAAMVRIFLGEGQVTAVDGEQLTVDLGWRSRVAPGAELEVMDRTKSAPPVTLEVTRVELDQCTARGKARVGDRVRVLRK